MVNCCICEDIYKGQFKKQKYRIWSVMGRESVLSYWYVVMYDTTFNQKYNIENVDLKKVNDEITNQAIDIRTLPNYKQVSGLEILHYGKTIVAPMIKEAIKKGYIHPI